MAEETQEAAENTTEEAPKKSSLIPLILIAVVALGAGIATPIVMSKLGGATEAGEAEEASLPDENDKPMFVPFGDVTVNLNSDQLNRFLHVDIALQVRESKKMDVETEIEDSRQILHNWLISYLADQDIEEIRGAAGHNRLRREIRDQFNTLLYQGGIEKIDDILFQDFNVQ